MAIWPQDVKLPQPQSQPTIAPAHAWTAGLLRAPAVVQVAAVVGFLVGNIADWLHTDRGWRLARVRLAMQTIANVGKVLHVVHVILTGLLMM